MLYIMRHGKTDWNALRKLQGRTDIALNDEGRAMARAAGKKYSGVHLDICYCSPLKRAKETAELFFDQYNSGANADIPIITDSRLMEMSFGIYEGIESSFDIPDCPINELFYHPEAYKAVENGEELSQLFKRTGELLNTVILPQVQQGKDILIVGHGAMNSAIICQVKNLPLEQFWSAGIKQCEIMQLI